MTTDVVPHLMITSGCRRPLAAPEMAGGNKEFASRPAQGPNPPKPRVVDPNGGGPEAEFGQLNRNAAPG